MACETCEKIADEIQCQGCADELIHACEANDCWASSILRQGEINGHKIIR